MFFKTLANAISNGETLDPFSPSSETQPQFPSTIASHSKCYKVTGEVW